MKKFVYLLIFLIADSWMASARRSASDSWDSRQLRQKTDYIWREAINRYLDDDLSSYFSLLNYAVTLNPEDVELWNEYAPIPLFLDNDSAASEKAILMLGRYFNDYPDDLPSALQYASQLAYRGDYGNVEEIYGVLHNRFPDKTEITRTYAQLLGRTGDTLKLAKALELYDSLEVIEGLTEDISASRLQIFLTRGDTAAVITEGRRHILEAPLSPEANLFCGVVYQIVENHDSALAYFNRACELDPDNADAQLRRAAFYNEIGDSASFDREIFNVLKMENLDMGDKLSILRQYVTELFTDSLQDTRIRDLFDSMVELHPLEPDLRNLYASYLIYKEDREAAIEQLSRVVDLQPENIDNWTNLLTQLSGDEDTERFKSVSRRATELFPNDKNLYIISGIYFSLREQDTDALADLLKAHEIINDENNPDDYYQRSSVSTMIGDILYKSGLHDEAFTMFEEGLVFNPTNTVCLNNFAYMLACDNRDLDKARRMIERALAYDPDDPTWIDTYAWVLFRQGNYEEAKQQIDIALEYIEAGDGEIDFTFLDHAGDIYFFNDLHEQAINFWRRALALDPENEKIKQKANSGIYVE